MAVKNKIFLPTLISSITYQPVRTLPHIYFYNGLKDCEDYYIQHYPEGSTTSVTESVQNKFPYLDYYDGLEPTTGSNSLLFFNETPPYGVTPTGSLYTQYWDKYVSLLYNPRTRLIKASAIIPLADYFEMELNDIVQWRGNYYHLRAINDYNLKDGTCKLELLGPIIRDAASISTLDCSFYFSSSFEGIVPTTTTTISPTTSTTTLAPTTTTTFAPTTTTTFAPTTTTTFAPTTTTTLEPTTTSTTLSPTTSTSTTTAAPTGEWPTDGNTFRMEVQVSGSTNFATGSNAYLETVIGIEDDPFDASNITSSVFIETDITASSVSNNIVHGGAFAVSNFSSSNHLGTTIVVYRLIPTGSTSSALQKASLLDGRSAPNPTVEDGPAESYIIPRTGEIGQPYTNGYFYTSFDTASLSKFQIGSNLIGESYWYQMPGTKNSTTVNTITSLTGMEKYKFYAISPTASLTPVATDPSWSLTLFTGDSALLPQDNDSVFGYVVGGTEYYNNLNVAAISVWDRVLSDSEVANVHYYYSSSLGLDIGPTL